MNYLESTIKPASFLLVVFILILSLPIEYFFSVSQGFKEQIFSNVIGGFIVGIILLLYSNRVTRSALSQERMETSRNTFEAVVFPALKYALKRKYEAITANASYVGGGSTKIVNLSRFYDENKLELINYLNAFKKNDLKEGWISFNLAAKLAFIEDENLDELITRKCIDFLTKNGKNISYLNAFRLYVKWRYFCPKGSLEEFYKLHPGFILPDERLLPEADRIWDEDDVLAMCDIISHEREKLTLLLGVLTKYENYF